MKKISRLTALLLALMLIFQMTAVATEEPSTEDVYISPTPIPETELNVDVLSRLRSDAVAAANAIDVVRGIGVISGNDSISMRENPNVLSKELAVLPVGTFVVVYDTTDTGIISGEWQKIRYSGQDGYVGSAYLELCACSVAEGAGLEVHADNCPDRMYYTSLCTEMTAEELFAAWDTYTAEAQEFMLYHLGQSDMTKQFELKRLLYRAELPACDCGNVERDLKDHADSCALKAYYMSLCREKSAAELYSDWAYHATDAQEYMLMYLSWTDQAKLAELDALLNMEDRIYEQLIGASTLEELKVVIDSYGQIAFEEYFSSLEGEEREALDDHFKALCVEFLSRLLATDSLTAFDTLIAFMPEDGLRTYLGVLDDEQYISYFEKYSALGGVIDLSIPECDCIYDSGDILGHESSCSRRRFFGVAHRLPVNLLAFSWQNYSTEEQAYILSAMEDSDWHKALELKLAVGLFVEKKGVSPEGIEASFIGNIPEDVTISISHNDTHFEDVPYELVFNVDITPVDGNGNKWQPAEGESVVVVLDIASLNLSESLAEGTVLNILHETDAGMEDLGSAAVETGMLMFETSSFSAFAGAKSDNQYYWENDNYIFLDLWKGSIFITNGQAEIRDAKGTVLATVTNSGNSKTYYIVQSNADNEDAAKDKDLAYYAPVFNAETGEFTTPAYPRVSGWAGYIHGRESVENVVSQWNSSAKVAGRVATSNYIDVTGGVSCNIIIENIWSSRNTKSVSASAGRGGLNFVGSGGTLTIVGDNRLGALHYNGSVQLELTGANTETLTCGSYDGIANYWNTAIGGNDGSQGDVYALKISGGTIFAGTTTVENCTAIGAGGNDDGNVTITGGKVTAITSSSGTAIGGGIGYHSNGGIGNVTISGGNVHAVNHGIWLRDTASTKLGDVIIPASAIGGGSTMESSVSSGTTVDISGGTVYAKSVGGVAIGGGGSGTQNGGDVIITITGGNVTALSVGGSVTSSPSSAAATTPGGSKTATPGTSIGGGTGRKKGGDATVTISGDAKVYTGSIGGGDCWTKDSGNKIGSATVTISGGTTHGQVVMAKGASTDCTFNMSAGIIDNTTEDDFHFVEENGGAVWIENGTATMSGGTIQDCPTANAKKGGAVYVTGGNFIMTGGTIQNTHASESGGAVCVESGSVSISGSATKMQNCSAVNGGAIYVNGGSFTMTAGTLSKNTATANGGAAYVFNTPVTFGDPNASSTNLIVTENSAVNGGGFYFDQSTEETSSTISNGAINNNVASGCGGGIYMTGSKGVLYVTGEGKIEANKASNGGGLYLISGAHLYVTGGSITRNQAVGNGNAADANTSYWLDNVSGIGGGISVASGAEATQSVFELNGQQVGIYGNTASFGADDVFASGNNTRLTLPDQDDMTLEGEYTQTDGWYEDYPAGDARYEDGLSRRPDLGGQRYKSAESTVEANVADINTANKYVCVTLGVLKEGMGTLTITKVLLDPAGNVLHSDRLFVFEIERTATLTPGENFEEIKMTVAVPANGSEKTIDLPEGEYSIKELKVSGKFESVDGTEKIITINTAKTDDATRDVAVTFTNKWTEGKEFWLESATDVERNYYKPTNVQEGAGE